MQAHSVQLHMDTCHHTEHCKPGSIIIIIITSCCEQLKVLSDSTVPHLLFFCIPSTSLTKHTILQSHIIIIIIIIIIISFRQGIYTYIPETNCVPRQYSAAAILLLLFMVLILLGPVLNILYFYISTFRSMCAVPNMAVLRSSLTSCFLGLVGIFIIITIAYL